MKKYYFKIEIRYDIPATEDTESIYQTKTFTSDLFDNEKDCIDYGNKVIESNLWIEQYQGHVGQRLQRRYGYPLVAPRLKNGAQVFLSVLSLDILSFEDLCDELRKFNVPKITTKI